MIALCLQTPSGISLLSLLLSLVAIGTLAGPNSEYSIVNCHSSWSASSLPKAYNDSGFVTVPNNHSCNGNDIVELFCGPRNHTSMFWIVWNTTGVCNSIGNQTGNGSTLRVPCGNYTLQCVAELETWVYSRPVLISKDEDYIQTEPTEGKVLNETTNGNEENIITDENSIVGNYHRNILDTATTAKEQDPSRSNGQFTKNNIIITAVCLAIGIILIGHEAKIKIS